MTGGLRFRSVRQGDEEVLAALEAMVEPTPWTVGDFADVLRNGWFCDVLELDDGSIGAWAVVMPVLDEAELLTIGVRPDLQGRGLGRAMLAVLPPRGARIERACDPSLRNLGFRARGSSQELLPHGRRPRACGPDDA